MERFPVIDVGQLVVCADNDKAGMEASRACKQRYGSNAVIWRPHIEGMDFADLLGAASVTRRTSLKGEQK
jgi:DNA primase